MAQDYVAGCAAGVANVLVGHPFDTIKVRLQTQDPRKPVFRGAVHCLWYTVKKESPLGLYRGVTSPLMGISAINALVFGAHSSISQLSPQPQSWGTQLAAGAVAGGLQSLVCSPMELVKSRLQIQTGAANNLYHGPFHCFHQIFIAQGFPGIFRGLSCTLMRDIPGFAFYFGGFAIVRDSAIQRGLDSSLATLAAGGIAGILSWIFNYPADVIKSRLQCDGMGSQQRYSGIIDCCRKSYHAEGFQCFYKGLGVTLIRAFPANAATFFAYSLAISFLLKTKRKQKIEIVDSIREIC